MALVRSGIQNLNAAVFVNLIARFPDAAEFILDINSSTSNEADLTPFSFVLEKHDALCKFTYRYLEGERVPRAFTFPIYAREENYGIDKSSGEIISYMLEYNQAICDKNEYKIKQWLLADSEEANAVSISQPIRAIIAGYFSSVAFDPKVVGPDATIKVLYDCIPSEDHPEFKMCVRQDEKCDYYIDIDASCLALKAVLKFTLAAESITLVDRKNDDDARVVLPFPKRNFSVMTIHKELLKNNFRKKLLEYHVSKVEEKLTEAKKLPFVLNDMEEFKCFMEYIRARSYQEVMNMEAPVIGDAHKQYDPEQKFISAIQAKWSIAGKKHLEKSFGNITLFDPNALTMVAEEKLPAGLLRPDRVLAIRFKDNATEKEFIHVNVHQDLHWVADHPNHNEVANIIDFFEKKKNIPVILSGDFCQEPQRIIAKEFGIVVSPNKRTSCSIQTGAAR